MQSLVIARLEGENIPVAFDLDFKADGGISIDGKVNEYPGGGFVETERSLMDCV